MIRRPLALRFLFGILLVLPTPSPSVAQTPSPSGSESEIALRRPETILDYLSADRPMVIAHRGFSSRAPENTLAAVDLAIEIGADMVEIDVAWTADGKVIVLHDETLDRTTDGSGLAREKTLEQIRRLDAGSWFDPRFADEKIPTLDEVLELTRNRILVNVEIKGEAVSDEAEDGIARKVADAILSHDMADRVIVSSFDPRASEQIHAYAPAIHIGALYNRKLHRLLLPSEIARPVSGSAFHINKHYLRGRMLREARRHDLPVAVYTVNNRLWMRWLIYRGVDAVFTDYPDRMLRLLRRRHTGG